VLTGTRNRMLSEKRNRFIDRLCRMAAQWLAVSLRDRAVGWR
jgi:hypothetical protein